MARTRKAILSAAFAYAQFVLSMATAYLLLPFILGKLGARDYGLWLATGELLGYLAMTDLGVFSVLPWLIGIAEGKGERETIHRLLANGLALGVVVGGAIILGSVLICALLPALLRLTPAEADALRLPLLLLGGVAGLSCPLRVFEAVLVAKQDVAFLGVLKAVQLVLGAVVTWVLLDRGWGFYGLAVAFVLPAGLNYLAFVVRATATAPGLFRAWPRPTWGEIRYLLAGGVGTWMGGIGRQLLAASNGLVITLLGHPEWVPTYVVMAKVPQFLQQLCRVIPDSGLMGMAQVYGEGRLQRIREVIHCLLLGHLFLAGGAACVILAINPAFIHWWIGAGVFGGQALNVFLAVNLLVNAFAHSLIIPVGVIGKRVQIGVATLCNGAVYFPLALGMGALWGLAALPLALSVSTILTTVWWVVYLQHHLFQIPPRTTLFAWLAPWLLRVTPTLVAAGLVGYFLPAGPLGQVVGLAVPVGLLYLLLMRRLLAGLPLPEVVRRHWFARLLGGGDRGTPRGGPGPAAAHRVAQEDKQDVFVS
jgi:O-antigen/teichoic acid export membrane protein